MSTISLLKVGVRHYKFVKIANILKITEFYTVNDEVLSRLLVIASV